MDIKASNDLDGEQQLWDGLEATVSKDCPTNNLIDDTLRSFLNLVTDYRGKYINSEHDIARCSLTILSAPLFERHDDYVRRQFVHSLLQEDDPNILIFVTSFLLFDIRQSESTAEIMNEEGAFTRLVDLASGSKQEQDFVYYRLLLELLYEMSRIQQIKLTDLVYVDDSFVFQLFELIEDLSGDADDPYHSAVIRVLLVLNEQFMVLAHDPGISRDGDELTNRVIQALTMKGSKYRTFGSDIILLLNRESETSLQLLTLKLMYLLFTTPSTQEYFYTNDLRVLVDILLRNLLDLPSDASALRHTYLRVLYPLLAHTQLRHPPHYKCDEIRNVLAALVGPQCIGLGEDTGDGISGHFEETDGTTKRLVKRCRTVTWLLFSEMNGPENDELKPLISPIDLILAKKVPPAPPDPRKLRKKKSSNPRCEYLVPQHQSAGTSALSVLEVAAKREKPGIMTPSKSAAFLASAKQKEKPVPPRTRRSTWSRRRSEVGRPMLDGDVDEVAARISVESFSLDDQDVEELSTTSQVAAETQEETSFAKQPPPAPKARRWRGKRRQQEDEGGGHTALPGPAATISPTRGPIERKSSSFEQEQPRPSVAEALSRAQVQAVDGLNETWNQGRMAPSSAGFQTVLAPPLPAPSRGVPSPSFSHERSPFADEKENG